MTATPGRSLGGRFSEATDPILERINRSVDVDRRLWRQDIAGSRAHAEMLGAVGLLDDATVAALRSGLTRVEDELASGTFVFEASDEDIHMAVERRLGELVGDPARRLHTGRSRNDQVMTDTTLWLRDAMEGLRARVARWIDALLTRAEEGVEVPMPSFTHLQPAQVSSVAQWLLSHAAEAWRHLRRADALIARLDECPLGSGASAGSYLPLDRRHTAAALGFAAPSINAVASTGSRVDLLDAIGWMSLVGVTLSRLGEELVLFASPAYGFVQLPDRLTTGSSLLPHKRNPDGAELLRAGGKLAAADFVALASTTSGLVSGYSKDLQFDKAILFRAHDQTCDLLDLAILHVEALSWDRARLAAACGPELAALWLADRLVLAGLPFRTAHHWVGAASRSAGDERVSLADAFGRRSAGGDGLSAAQITAIAQELAAQTPESLLAGLQTEGSAGPASTRAQLARLRSALAEARG
jgi:argininosuccinate lyase